MQPLKEYSINEQERIFSGFWDKFSKQIASGQSVVDFPVGFNLKPHHITTVVRLPAAISRPLYNELEGILPSDYHYPIGDMHLTLINLDKLLHRHKNINWQKLGVYISEEMQGLPNLEFQVKGIGVFPTTVFAQIFDTNGALELYRAAIVRAVGKYLVKEVDISEFTALVPGITFANLIRFKNKPQPSLIELLTTRREVEIGSFKPSEFELVTTNKLFSSKETITNAIIKK